MNQQVNLPTLLALAVGGFAVYSVYKLLSTANQVANKVENLGSSVSDALPSNPFEPQDDSHSDAYDYSDVQDWTE